MSFTPGSVSYGTMRPEDLIPTFISTLDDLKQDLSLSVGSGTELETIRRVSALDDFLGDIEQRIGTNSDYYDSEDSDWDLDALFDKLNELAPEGYTFGAHPGDGSDYGFWPHELYGAF